MISIIVSAYKTEKYLKKCVDSILAQSDENFELILVNNASPDHCGEIIDGYVALDTRVKSIHLIKNEGPGGGRNGGLDICKGEYICFVDSDDTVEQDYLRCLRETIEKEHADMSWCGIQIVDELGNRQAMPCDEDKILQGSDKMLGYISDKNAPLAPWGKLYTRTLMDGFRYATGALDDGPVQYKLFWKAEKIAYTSKGMYNYFIHMQSTTHTFESLSIERQMIMTQGFYDAWKVSRDLYPEISNNMYSTYVKSLCGAYGIAKMYNMQNSKEMADEEKRIWKLICEVDRKILSYDIFCNTYKGKVLFVCLQYSRPLLALFYGIKSKISCICKSV